MNLEILELDRHEDNQALIGYATEGSAGFDISLNEQVALTPFGKKLVGTGIAMAIPEGHVGILVPRSSTGNFDLTLANTVGVIDSDYRGEVKVYLKNNSGSQQIFYPGDTLCQIIIIKYEKLNVKYVKSLPATNRTGGFGSTNKKEK